MHVTSNVFLFCFLVIVCLFNSGMSLQIHNGKVLRSAKINSFRPIAVTSETSQFRNFISSSQLYAIDLSQPSDSTNLVYAGIFAATIIPSLLFVKFVGDSADSSRGSLSEETQENFKRKMMQQPTINLSIPSTEEEQLKQQIAKAYMQDKDVDVAVLEEKLKQRAQWRKEVILQQKAASNAASEDEDGW